MLAQCGSCLPACPANLLGNYVAALLHSILNSPPPPTPSPTSLYLSCFVLTHKCCSLLLSCCPPALLCPASPFPLVVSQFSVSQQKLLAHVASAHPMTKFYNSLSISSCSYVCVFWPTANAISFQVMSQNGRKLNCGKN